MQLYQIFSWLIVLTALFSFINFKYFKFPSSVGLMVFTLLLSNVMVIVGNFFHALFASVCHIIAVLDFSILAQRLSIESLVKRTRLMDERVTNIVQ